MKSQIRGVRIRVQFGFQRITTLPEWARWPYHGHMRMEYIDSARHPVAADFLAYCGAHGREHDESNIPGADWGFGNDAPSFAAIEENGSMGGVACALLTPAYRAARRARAAVLHALDESRYGPLVAALSGAVRTAADDLFLFLPRRLKRTRNVLEGLGFAYERTAYPMTAPTDAPGGASAPSALPPGYALCLVEPGDAAALAAFVDVRNRNFRELKGATAARAEDLAAFIASPEFMPGGMFLLRAPDGRPCATLALSRDLDEGTASIGAISVERDHRGKGLARFLLRTALSRAAAEGFLRASLSVNADNETALRLYRSEGFVEGASMDCLSLRL